MVGGEVAAEALILRSIVSPLCVQGSLTACDETWIRRRVAVVGYLTGSPFLKVTSDNFLPFLSQ